MADKTIKLRKRISSGYQVLNPETKVANVLKGLSDLNPADDNLLQQAAVNERKFGIVDNEGFHLLDKDDVKSVTGGFAIADSGHYHPISQVFEDGTQTTSLQDLLDGKVPLDSHNKVIGSYFPDFARKSAVKYLSGGDLRNATQETPITLRELFGITAADAELAILSGPDTDTLNRSPFKVGSFVIAKWVSGGTNTSPSSGWVRPTVHENGGITYNYVFRQADNIDDTTSDSIVQNNVLKVEIEVYDRVVLSEIVENSATEYTLYFDVINSRNGQIGFKADGYGVVALGDTETAISNFVGNVNLSQSNKIISEGLLRSAMRDIREVNEIVPSTNFSLLDIYLPNPVDLNNLPTFSGQKIIVGSNSVKEVYENQSGTLVNIGTILNFDHTKIANETFTFYDPLTNILYGKAIQATTNGVSYYNLQVGTPIADLTPVENDLVFMT